MQIDAQALSNIFPYGVTLVSQRAEKRGRNTVNIGDLGEGVENIWLQELQDLCSPVSKDVSLKLSISTLTDLQRQTFLSTFTFIS